MAVRIDKHCPKLGKVEVESDRATASTMMHLLNGLQQSLQEIHSTLEEKAQQLQGLKEYNTPVLNPGALAIENLNQLINKVEESIIYVDIQKSYADTLLSMFGVVDEYVTSGNVFRIGGKGEANKSSRTSKSTDSSNHTDIPELAPLSSVGSTYDTGITTAKN